MKNCVYRFINNQSEVIYVGKAKDLRNRLNSHTHLSKECYIERNYVEYIQCDTEDDMDFMERYFISKYKPKYNKIHANKEITFCIQEFNSRVWTRLDNNQMRQTRVKRPTVDNRKLDKLLQYEANLKAIQLQQQNELQEKQQKPIICTHTGQVFNNLVEYKDLMGINYCIKELVDWCDNKILLTAIHPNYSGNVMTSPMYLHEYESLDTDIKQNMERKWKVNTKPVICLTTGRLFDNLLDAQDTYKITVLYNMVRCCEGMATYSGVDVDTPLVWRWCSDYMLMTEDDIQHCVDRAYKAYKSKAYKY